jgi:hypothetical protein
LQIAEAMQTQNRAPFGIHKTLANYPQLLMFPRYIEQNKFLQLTIVNCKSINLTYIETSETFHTK